MESVETGIVTIDQTALEETGIEQKAQIDLVETGTKETIVETGIDQMSGSGIETMTEYIVRSEN